MSPHPSRHPISRRPTCRLSGRAIAAIRGGAAAGGVRRHDQRGVTTAEYAVATAAGAGFAGLLFKLLTGGFGNHLLTSLFNRVLSVLGLG